MFVSKDLFLEEDGPSDIAHDGAPASRAPFGAGAFSQELAPPLSAQPPTVLSRPATASRDTPVLREEEEPVMTASTLAAKMRQQREKQLEKQRARSAMTMGPTTVQPASGLARGAGMVE